MDIKLDGMSINEFVKNAVKNGKHGTEVINSVNGGMSINGSTIICNGSVLISRNGKKFVLKGNRIEKRNDQWYVDGKPVDWEQLGGKYDEENVVKIEITGDVQNLSTTCADVIVNGSVANLKTGSGDVQCGDVVNVYTGSGDVACGNVAGMVSTGSGDIYRR